MQIHRSRAAAHSQRVPRTAKPEGRSRPCGRPATPNRREPSAFRRHGRLRLAALACADRGTHRPLGQCVIGIALLLGCALVAQAATYYVDFEGGSDKNTGDSAAQAWQHSPGDSQATDTPRGTTLGAGDTVIFKGGVVYRGSISLRQSGQAGKPLVLDGNTAGTFGKGQAIIDGSIPLENLKRCTSAAEAHGNPNFRNIYWTTVPRGAKWDTLNLCQDLQALAWSMDRNPTDPILQESPADYYKTDAHIPQTDSSLDVKPIGMGVNGGRPLIAMFDQSGLSAVIENMNGGAIEISLPKPVTVTELAVTPQQNYVNPKRMSFVVDGKEVLAADLEMNARNTEQKFKLPKPLTFSKLTVKFVAAYPLADGTVRNWGAIQRIAAFDAAGNNVLLGDRKTTLRHDEAFAQTDPNHYDNALLALYAKPAAVYYKRVIGFDPATHTIEIEALKHNEQPYEKGGAFSIVNNPRFIDQPGEYAMMLTPEADGSHKLFLWPPDGTPRDLTRGAFGKGIALRGPSYVTVRGFWIRKQGWSASAGIDIQGPGTDVVIRDCKITNLRGRNAGIHVNRISNLLVANCEVSDNAGHTKGIVLRNASNIVARGCLLRKNSSTALDYYTVTNGVVEDCTVIDNTGMHANGLTFYVGCRDILVQRNVVRNGNAGLTVQDGENMIIRNNIIEGGRGGSPALGLWSGKPFNNIVITNNVLRFHGDDDHWSAAIYGGNPGATGYMIHNNIVDGFSGLVFRQAVYSHNIFTRLGPGLPASRLGDNVVVDDLTKLFVDPDKNNYRPVKGSPAIDAGIALSTVTEVDVRGAPRPQGKAVDIGPYETPLTKTVPTPTEPATFRFSFGDFRITKPEPFTPTYEMKFKKRSDAETITLKGVDRTGEGGGKVNLRTTRGGYISGWDNAGHWLEWTVEVKQAGAYELCIAHGSQTPAKRKVMLNGEPVKGMEAVAFTPTGDWTLFEKAGLPDRLMLKAGKNVIRFVNVEGSHNFKTLEFIPVEAE